MLDLRWKTGVRGSRAAAGLVCGLLLIGCSGGGSRGGEEGSIDVGLDRSERYVRSQGGGGTGRGSASGAGEDDGRPPALVDGTPVRWGELRSRLGEAAGAAALEEIALERMLRREIRRAGIEIEQADLERERDLLLRSFEQSGAADESIDGGRLLMEVRRARGLGPERFESLLWRNAALRALVRDEVEIDAERIERTGALLYGPRYRVRIITAETLGEASAALKDLRSGAPFGQVAAERSTDASAARGGVIEPISPADPAYPAALRTALGRLTPGEVSSPIAIEGGYALLILDAVIEGEDFDPDSARADLEQRARLAEERVLMQRRASRLLRSAGVTVFDPSLDWSWRRRGGGNNQ